jgi:murein DD-endopeptidase MepM/ murein hydrolase activator NlpD
VATQDLRIAAGAIGHNSVDERPLTRRELRERERQEQARVPVEISEQLDLIEREVVAPALTDAPLRDFDQLLTDVPTTTRSTAIQLPMRARLRSERRVQALVEPAPRATAEAQGFADSGEMPALVPASFTRARARGAGAEAPAAPAPIVPVRTAVLPVVPATPAAPAATKPISLVPAEPARADAFPVPFDEEFASIAPIMADSRRSERNLRRMGPATARAVDRRAATIAAAPSAVTTTPAAPADKSTSISRRLRRGAATGVTIVAMSFVALMAVSTSLPAEALLSSADVQAAAVAARQSGSDAPAQTLALGGGTDTLSVQRDGYESKSVAEVAAASGIRLEATFTNNPNGTIQWPFAVGVHIGDHFGYRDCAGCSENHQGQDFNPGLGAPIQAIADGVVSYTADGEGSLGVHMIIDHMIDGKKVSSVYAHMEHGSMLFNTGDVVKVGQVIGKTGNTGMSTGPHLHFEIRLGGKDGQHVDPLAWLYAHVN